MLDLGGFFHHTCVLRHNIFWSSAINLGLTVTTKRQRSRGGRTKCSGWTPVCSRAKAAPIGGPCSLIPIKPPHCPTCQAHMMLTRIEHNLGGRLVRIFERPQCEYVQKLLIEYPQNVGPAADR